MTSALMVGLIVLGAFASFRPFLTHRMPHVADIPTPTSLSIVSRFQLPPGGKDCVETVTVDPKSQMVVFGLHLAKGQVHGRGSIGFKLSAPGYQAESSVPVPRKLTVESTTLPITAPAHEEIATACFLNHSNAEVLLDGTTEPRTISRSLTQVNGNPAIGDVALAFYERQPDSLLDRLGEMFAHSSNLTDNLIPTWLIWILAALIAFGVPCGIVLAFYLAVRENLPKQMSVD